MVMENLSKKRAGSVSINILNNYNIQNSVKNGI